MPPQVVHVKNASKVAAALANEKCQKILEYLGKKTDATETQISKDLDIPLSTVHYNMKVLSDAQLVLGDEYTYSSKGKEVTHYKLNKNPIVIVQEESSILDVLKAITPAAILAAGVGVAYSLATKAPVQTAAYAPEATRIADSGPALMAAKAAEVAPVAAEPSMLPWFLLGVVVTLVFSLIVVAAYHWWSGRFAR